MSPAAAVAAGLSGASSAAAGDLISQASTNRPYGISTGAGFLEGGSKAETGGCLNKLAIGTPYYQEPEKCLALVSQTRLTTARAAAIGDETICQIHDLACSKSNSDLSIVAQEHRLLLPKGMLQQAPQPPKVPPQVCSLLLPTVLQHAQFSSASSPLSYKSAMLREDNDTLVYYQMNVDC